MLYKVIIYKSISVESGFGKFEDIIRDYFYIHRITLEDDSVYSICNEVLDKRDTYQDLLDTLHKEGFVDPFHISNAQYTFVENLFGKYDPENQFSDVEKMLLIFRSVIDANSNFEFNGNVYKGLEPDEGGLSIRGDDNLYHPQRLKKGLLLPDTIIDTESYSRVALCLEYSILLTNLMRIAGLDAGIRDEEKHDITLRLDWRAGHAYTIVTIDNTFYELDATFPLIEITNTPPFTDTDALVDCYTNIGVCFSAMQKHGSGLYYLFFANHIDPRNTIVFFNIACIFVEIGRYDNARDMLQTCIKEDFRAYAAWILIAQMDYNEQKAEEALQAVTRGLELNKFEGSAWLLKAQIHEDKEDFKEAEDAYASALNYSNAPEAWLRYSEFLLRHNHKRGSLIAKIMYRARKYFEEGNFERTIAYCKKVLKLSPDYVYALHQLGLSYFYVNNYEEAENIFLKLTVIDSKSVGVYQNLAFIYHSRGKLKEANEYSFKCAQLLYKYEMYIDAFEHLEGVLEFDPKNREAKKLFKEVKKYVNKDR
ncbi:tetratricopeptide repeat protein [Candidatus Margulisiibacteriota bacterium]